jgi:hypothetical protein
LEQGKVNTVKSRALIGLLLPAVLLAGCASAARVERRRQPLSTGTGSYLLTEKRLADRHGERMILLSRFYFGSSDFYRSEVLTIQKVATEAESYYLLVLDLAGGSRPDVRSIALKVDQSLYRLTDPKPWSNRLPVGAVRFEERHRFRLEPQLVASLRAAGTIRIQDLAGPITLSSRQRAVLQSFLRDTAEPGAS